MNKREFIKASAALSILPIANAYGEDKSTSKKQQEMAEPEKTNFNSNVDPKTKKTGTDNSNKSFDYIIVGGGTAGPVIASRLSENPNISVLLIEAGKENTKEAMYYIGGQMQMMSPDTNWGFSTVPQKGLGGRKIMSPRGKLLGGSASINVGSWSRGYAANYNSWNLKGWDWETVKDWYKKIENSDKGSDEYRGMSGPMKLEVTPKVTFMTDVFKEACKEVGLGTTKDLNGEKLEGFDNWQCIFREGRRHNTVANYLDKARLRPNLTIQLDTFVTKVIIENKKATGVECLIDEKKEIISANKEVIICTGTFATPKLLMFSGIGPAKYLKSLGMDVVHDLPGVGENLSDHILFDFGITAPDGIGESLRSNAKDPKQLEEWRKTGYGPLSVGENTSVAFCKSSPDVAITDIELMFNINAPVQWGSPPPKNAGYNFYVGLVQPKSKGTIKLASTDPKEAMLIDPNYLGDKRDIATCINAMKIVMKFAKTKALGKYTDLSTATISLDASDKEIEAYIRNHSSTIYHPVGTAKMGNENDPMAVVNNKLQVKGLSNLRIADASVIPELITGHTMAPTVLVAERVVDFINGD